MTTPEKPARAPHWIAVPAGTHVAQCRDERCAKPIYFVAFGKANRPHPVNCDVEGGLRPSAVAETDSTQLPLIPGVAPETPHAGRGQSHFADCVAAADFRRGVQDVTNQSKV